MQEIVLTANKLTKKYGSQNALDDVDLTVYSGDIYGIIGQNGAGKTTLMRVLNGLSEKTSGDFTFFGKSGADSDNVRQRIGCLIENPAFFPGLSVAQNLRYYSLQKGMTDDNNIEEALKMVGLYEERKKKYRKLSLGMKQRLGLALSFFDDPDLVFLDEPLNGIDPLGISKLRETICSLNREKGMTFVISSHILSELYNIANRFLFMDRGRVLCEMTKEEVDERCRRYISVETNDTPKAVAVLEEKMSLTDYNVVDKEHLRIYQTGLSAAEVNRTLVMNGSDVSEIFVSGLTLEDFYLSLIGEGSK